MIDRHVTFCAAGIEVVARPEPQPGGAPGSSVPGVSIILCSPSASIASCELRFEPAVAKKLLSDVLSVSEIRLGTVVTITKLKTGDEHTYVFRTARSTIFVRGLLVAEALRIIEQIVKP